MSATIVVYINGTDLSSHSIFVYGTPEGWLATPVSTRGVVPVASRVRSYLSDTDDVAERRIDAAEVFGEVRGRLGQLGFGIG